MLISYLGEDESGSSDDWGASDLLISKHCCFWFKFTMFHCLDKGNLHASFNAQAFQRESNCNLWQRKTHPILQKLKLKNLLGRISCWVLRSVCTVLVSSLFKFFARFIYFWFQAPFSFPILSPNSYLDHSCIGLALLGKKSWCFWCTETPPFWCFRVGVLSYHTIWISCTIHIDLLVKEIETVKIQ
jgi:hypothetical protein